MGIFMPFSRYWIRLSWRKRRIDLQVMIRSRLRIKASRLSAKIKRKSPSNRKLKDRRKPSIGIAKLNQDTARKR